MSDEIGLSNASAYQKADTARLLELAEQRLADVESERDSLRIRLNALESATQDQALGVLRSIVNCDPLVNTSDDYGDSAQCFFCEGECYSSTRRPAPSYLKEWIGRHTPNCEWIAALRLLGYPLGDMHTLIGEMVDTTTTNRPLAIEATTVDTSTQQRRGDA